MLIISHRGNTVGPNPQMENHPTYLKYAIQMGFHVEVDVWIKDGRKFLGHDKPQYEVSSEFFHNERYFLHCKNIEAMATFADHPLVNAFFHNEEDIALTSKGLLWSYPRASVLLTKKSIAVMPERVENWAGIDKCYGICTDDAIKYKKLYS